MSGCVPVLRGGGVVTGPCPYPGAPIWGYFFIVEGGMARVLSLLSNNGQYYLIECSHGGKRGGGKPTNFSTLSLFHPIPSYPGVAYYYLYSLKGSFSNLTFSHLS